MKKLFTTSIALLTIFNLALAQAPTNLGFETWVDFVTYEDPTNWGTLNFGSAFVQGFPVTATKSTDAHTDSFAIKLTTQAASADLSGFGFNHDTVPGLMVYGNIGGNETGFSYTQRPTSVQFWYKYTPAYDDSAGFLVQLTKWNPITQQQFLVGRGAVSMKDTVTTYTLNDAVIQYTDTVTPDSMFIIMFSSFEAVSLLGSNLNTTLAKPGSTLLVDDIKLMGVTEPTAIYTPLASAINFSLYPNPATSTLNIKCSGYDFTHGALTLDIIDMTGRLVQSVAFNTMQSAIDVSNLSAGMYTYRLKDARGAVKAGKFNIAR